MAEQLAQDGRELDPRHALFLDKISAYGFMPRALQAEDLRHLFGAQEPQPLRRLPCLFVAPLGSENLRKVLPRDRAQLLGKLPELGPGGALPDNRADEALPGNAA